MANPQISDAGPVVEGEVLPAKAPMRFGAFVPKKTTRWMDYEDPDDPDLGFPVLLAYVDNKVQGDIAKITTGGKLGRRQGDPKKVPEAYATCAFLDFQNFVDDNGNPLPNTLSNRMTLLKNGNFLNWVVVESNNAKNFVDMGDETDQKK